MQHITSVAELRNAIRSREALHDEHKQVLVDQFSNIVGQFNPANILQNTLRNLSSSNSLIDNLAIPLFGSVTGYLVGKLFVFGSENKERQNMGSIVQTEVTNVIVQHPEIVKLIGRYIFQGIFKKKESNK